MATATTAPTLHSQKRHGHRQRQVVSRRRRIGEEDSSGEGVQGANDPVNDDSLSGESTASDEGGPSNESDMKGIDETPQTLPMSNSLRKSPEPKVNSSSKSIAAPLPGAPTGEANGLSSTVSEPQSTTPTPGDARTTTSAPRAAQPAIVSSSAAPTPRRETAYDRQRREHDLYKQRRDEDPSFVPNRGAFFMHDHRGAGPAANGFRPFSSRSARSSRGRGGFGGSYLPMHSQNYPADPTANQPWAHDMHEAVTQPHAPRLPISRRQNMDTASRYGAGQYAGNQYAANQYAGSQYAGSQYAGSQYGSQYGGSHYGGSHYGGSRYGGSRAFPPVPVIPTCPPSSTPINRSLSVENPLGTVTVRVFFPPMKEPAILERFRVTQYTKLPDHRPPLRRDKAVVIDLPGHPKRQIFPAVDRSFIFIPRALRPNQRQTQGGRTRSVMGSFSGFSHRTSVFGGSYYDGSMYSPSVALSRRSSFAQEGGRDFINLPTGSVISRPSITMDMEHTTRPVVRLPPTAGAHTQPGYSTIGVQGPSMHVLPPAEAVIKHAPQDQHQPSGGQGMIVLSDPGPNQHIHQDSNRQPAHPQPSQPAKEMQQPNPQAAEQISQQPQPKQLAETSSLSTFPPPQHHPLPQKPVFQETRPDHNLPMHQPRPRKTVSVDSLEPPPSLGASQPYGTQPYSMAFHQQVPLSLPRGLPPAELHSRHSSYQSHTTGTPLPQIPERAIHAAPFQPNVPPSKQQTNYSQPNRIGASSGPAYYGGVNHAYGFEPSSQQGYYYLNPPSYSDMVPTANVSPYVSGAPQAPALPYGQQSQVETSNPSSGNPRKMVAQEVNGMVYYVDVSQLPTMTPYTGYGQEQMSQARYMPGAGGMITPASAEGHYYEGQPGMAYY